MKMMTPRLMLASPSSGSGKTTVFCALLGVLKKRHVKTVAFKSGPDYIDPMFHRTVLHTPSHNLDMFLLGSTERTQQVMARYSSGMDMALLEGAMGYYDGIGTTCRNSAYELAQATKTPVILVLNGKGAALSLAASVKGFADFMPDSYIGGFILNNVSKSIYRYVCDAVEEASGVPACGYLPPLPEAVFESRHLGLVTADETAHIQQKLQLLQEAGEDALDIDRIIRLAQRAPSWTVPSWTVPAGETVTIAVARDEAFCFYYDAALDMLRRMGAVITYFSPLRDAVLPDCQGIYIGGGYPEIHAAALSANVSLRRHIRLALRRGLPCIAECGGFMYLLEQFEDKGQRFPWSGVISGTCRMTPHLTRFGYVTLTAQEDTAFCPCGTVLHGHEFHYSDSDHNGESFEAQKASGRRSWQCIHAWKNVWAGYPHIHLCGVPQMAQRFLDACRIYGKGEMLS